MTKKIPFHLIPHDLSFTDNIIVESAKEYGTPLYLYDRKKMESNWKELVNHLPINVNIYYSVKANPNLAIIKIFDELGANFEVASIGELKSVLQVGVAPSRIIFVGPGKTTEEIKYAIRKNIGAIISESHREVYDIQAHSYSLNKITPIALRINPGHGKGMLAMGGETQFGMDMEKAFHTIQDVNKLPNVEIIGIHGYLGTQILDSQVIIEHSRKLLEIADELQKRSGKSFSFIDIGGGFGVPYHENDSQLNLNDLYSGMEYLVDTYIEKHPYVNNIAVESGRFLVSSSGVFVTRVIDIKKSSKQTFVILDGGINVFGGFDRYVGWRPTPFRLLNRDYSEESSLTLCGPLCTPIDRLATNILLPLPKVNDLLIFYKAGAYGYTASPGLFLSHGYPSEILVSQDKAFLIRQRMSFNDMITNQKYY